MGHIAGEIDALISLNTYSEFITNFFKMKSETY